MQTRFAFLPDRAILSLEGPDTIALLERLITCNTQGWQAGEARYGALLTPQGKIIADFLALRTEAGVLLDTHRDAIADLEKRLKMFRLRADVEIAPLDGVIIVAGNEDATHGVRPVSGAQLVYVDPRYSGGRLRAIASETEWRQYHGHEAEWSLPPDTYHADRIAGCVPEFGADFGGSSVFPADVNMDRLGGVDYSKGCFVGQEVVSRMYRRGKIRKRTVTIAASGLAPGQTLESDGGAALGEITSAVDDVALARVRIDRVASSGKSLAITGPDWALDDIQKASAANDD